MLNYKDWDFPISYVEFQAYVHLISWINPYLLETRNYALVEIVLSLSQITHKIKCTSNIYKISIGKGTFTS